MALPSFDASRDDGRRAARQVLAQLRAPLIAAPMFKVSSPKLVAEACRHGIIGAFPSINARTPELFDAWIDEIEAATGQGSAGDWPIAPYAVNLLTHETNERFEPDLEIIRARKTPIVITSVGRPDRVVEDVHAYGGLVLADVGSLRHAERAAALGVDGMVLLCAGAGGQTGRLNPFAFIEAVRAFYDGLLIVAGGITRGRQLRALEVAGADLGYSGTRFLVTDESLADDEHKAGAFGATIDDVWDTDALSGIPANTLAVCLERIGLTPETRWIQAKRDGYDWAAVKQVPGVFTVGHGVGDVTRGESTADVVDRLVHEYSRARELG